MTVSAIFFLDLKGKVIVSRDYRGDVSTKYADKFMAKINELEEVSKVTPVIHDEGVNYIHLQVSNLYVLAVTRSNSNSMAIITFLHRMVDVFKHYFQELEEESLRDNFVIVYELLDEMMDYGYPQVHTWATVAPVHAHRASGCTKDGRLTGPSLGCMCRPLGIFFGALAEPDKGAGVPGQGQRTWLQTAALAIAGETQCPRWGRQGQGLEGQQESLGSNLARGCHTGAGPTPVVLGPGSKINGGNYAKRVFLDAVESVNLLVNSNGSVAGVHAALPFTAPSVAAEWRNPGQVRYLKVIEKSGYQALPWILIFSVCIPRSATLRKIA
eukprot:gene16046-22181_t